MHTPQRYLHHPDQIELRLLPLDNAPTERTSPLPLGLSLNTPSPHPRGEWLRISAPAISSDFCITALVSECHREGDHYRLHLAFLTPEQLFRGRMLEQLCQIALYQQRAPREEAERRALEWIEREAAHFPTDGL
ncbi:MAG: hypothetical protein SVU24_07735 [Pseudomonadota bacterium]|jgi:hypothetical protein|nr:hypothetical protein [Pseudomonadota bacterium]